MLKKLIKGICNPRKALLYANQLGLYHFLPDKAYLQWIYRLSLRKKLNLNAPETFNEKLQWLKLYDRRPEYTVMADKYLVRDYIAKTLGEEYLIPLLGVWDSPEAIDFAALPDQFVLKCNHNSGLGMCICKDKSKLDIPGVKKALIQGLRQNYYLQGREWPYKNIPRKIVCEQFMTNGGKELADYKIHNFGGEPKFILVCADRFSSGGLTEDFYTPDWERMQCKRPSIPNAAVPAPKPEQLETMLELSRILAKDIPFVRTDFYVIDGRVYFGEITFFPASGLAGFDPASWDRTLGSWLKLPDRTE